MILGMISVPMLILLAAAIFAAVVFVLWASGSITISYTLYNSGEGSQITNNMTVAYTGNSIIDYDITVNGAVTNQANDIYIDSANLLFLTIIASKDVTLKFNSSGSPTDTIPLKANVPWQWHKDSGIPIGQVIVGTAGIVTQIFHTNPGVAPADNTVVKYRGLQNV